SGAGTSGANGAASGTQVVAPIAVPVTVGGNAVSVLGDAGSSGSAAATPAGGAGSASSGAGTSGANGAASGTQVIAPIAVPVTVGGNAFSVLGDAGSSGSAAGPGSAGSAPSGGAGTDGSGTSGAGSVLGGSQVIAPVAAPVTVAGNAVSLLGDAASTGGLGPIGSAPSTGGTPVESGTSGADSVLGGSLLQTLIASPVTVRGNALSVLGDAGATGATGTVPGTGSTPGTRSGQVGAVEIVADDSVAAGIVPASLGVRALASTGVTPWGALTLGLALLLLGASAVALRMLRRS
ncbi:MAG: hypothetical protein HY996_04060, partial [Micrococcales bacterium]|nr:hypothetical protein [Micrococcales bacterium]